MVGFNRRFISCHVVVGFTRRFISCHVMVGFNRRFISCHVMVRFTRRFISCHVMVGFNRRFIGCHGVVRSGHRRFIIIIITTTPFEFEGREVGCPTVYEVYMVQFMMSIWYGI